MSLRDLSAQQKAAWLTKYLFLHGPVRAERIAALLYESEESVYKLLNNLGGVLPLVNDRGWWYIDGHPFAGADGLLRRVSDELAETHEGVLYCRPLLRREMVELRHILAQLAEMKEPVA